jgi:hypothetical protein
MSGMCTSIIMPNVCVSGCHGYLWFFDAPPEDGNLIAETYVGVTNTGHTQKNGAVYYVFSMEAEPFFYVCPV